MSDERRPTGTPDDSDQERGEISRDGWGNSDDNRNPTQPTSPDELVEEDPMRAPGLDDPEKTITD